MSERLGKGKMISRRKFLIGAGLGASAFAADQLLKDGLMLAEPHLEPESKKINVIPRRSHAGKGDRALGFLQGVKPLYLNENTFVYYNTDDDLLFQHNKAAFEPEREYKVSHRGGNRLFLIDKSIAKGANGFDIDAASLPNGTIVAEHGIVGHLDFGPIELGATFDQGEMELRTRIPKTVVDMLGYISSKSDPDDPFIAEIELKRGGFEFYDALSDLVSGIAKSQLPVRVFGNQRAVDRLFGVCEELSGETL